MLQEESVKSVRGAESLPSPLAVLQLPSSSVQAAGLSLAGDTKSAGWAGLSQRDCGLGTVQNSPLKLPGCDQELSIAPCRETI